MLIGMKYQYLQNNGWRFFQVTNVFIERIPGFAVAFAEVCNRLIKSRIMSNGQRTRVKLYNCVVPRNLKKHYHAKSGYTLQPSDDVNRNKCENLEKPAKHG
jgi:hypothetical protein